jgi:nucleotide-binding universal stress UspA family protein
LVPIAGGPNSRLALELAVIEADAIEQRTGKRPEVVALNLLLNETIDNTDTLEQRRQAMLTELEIASWPIELHLVSASDIVEGILSKAEGFDQIIIGASEEGLLEQSLFGSISQRVAEEALITVIMVKRHDEVKFGLRRWLMRRRKA